MNWCYILCMRMDLQFSLPIVMALSLVAPVSWAGSTTDVASLLEKPDSYQSQVVRVTGTVTNHRIRRGGENKCFQSFRLRDESGSIQAVHGASCAGVKNALRNRDVVTVEARLEWTSHKAGYLRVQRILAKVAPSAE